MLIFGIICILIIGQDASKQIFKRKILIISESLLTFLQNDLQSLSSFSEDDTSGTEVRSKI